MYCVIEYILIMQLLMYEIRFILILNGIHREIVVSEASLSDAAVSTAPVTK